MADDWVKMRTDLYRDPKVCMIADQMLAKDGDLAEFVSHSCRRDMTVTRNVMRNAVVGALVTVWGVLRRRGHRDGDNLTLNTATLAVIDDIADMPGLGDALEFVGWAVQDAEGVTLPNFFADYNVDPADEAKAKNAERQRRFREAKKVESSNVTVTLQRNAREEERRGEKSKKEHICVAQPHVTTTEDRSDDVPLEGTAHKSREPYSHDFEQFWNIYPTYRRRDKGNAWKAWVKALKSVTAEELIEKAEAYAASPVGRGEFSKLPASWLNARGWEDDPTAWGSAPEHRPRIPTIEELANYNPNG